MTDMLVLVLLFSISMLTGAVGLVMGNGFNAPMGKWEFISFFLFGLGMAGFMYTLTA